MMTKIQLKKELRKLGIAMANNRIKRSDILKVLGNTEAQKLKVSENDKWTVYKLPNDVDSVNGVSVRTTYDYLCTDTQWQIDEFWRQFKGMDPTNLYIFVSKTKQIGDPLYKLATIGEDQTTYVGADEQLAEVGSLNLPKINAPAAVDNKEGKCTCDIFEIMRSGCKCGGFQREQQQQKSLNSLTTKAQLKDQLYKLNIPVYAGKKIKKKDIEKALAAFQKKS